MNISLIIMLSIILGLVVVMYAVGSRSGNLDNIKANTTGDGQYGDAKFANKKEISQNYKSILFDSRSWRDGENLPKDEGIILGANLSHGKIYAMVSTKDNHTMVVSAPGGGKTTTFLYPNLEYCAACGMSFFATDTKGNVSEDFVPVLKDYYNMKTYVIDLRNPANYDGYNMLYLTNKYLDKYKITGDLADKARAEMYAKTIGSTIINLNQSSSKAGQNKFFYIAAEGVIAAVSYLVAEYCDPPKRHIVSVFKIIRQIIEFDPDTVNKKDVMPVPYILKLYNMLPESHIAKDLLSAAATAGEFKTIASILSTAVSQMLAFIDSEMEQMLCFNSIDIEDFVQNKTAIFFIFDESSNTKNMIGNLLIRQTYNELLKASEKYENNKLPHRIQYFLDEFGTYTAIEGVEQFFSAGRSRNIIVNPFLQSLSQLDEKYGMQTAKNIRSSCQNTIFTYLSPLSDDAKTFSDALGTQTVRGGSVSNRSGSSSHSSSTTYQMIKKPLQSPEQLRRLQKGNWILMSTETNPVKVKMPEFKRWNIELPDAENKYKLESKANRTVQYASRDELMGLIQYPGTFTASKIKSEYLE